jgi:hypothetical protein
LSLPQVSLLLIGLLFQFILREQNIPKALGTMPIQSAQVVVWEIVVKRILAVVQARLIGFASVLAFSMLVEDSWLNMRRSIRLGALTFVGPGYPLASFPKIHEARV